LNSTIVIILIAMALLVLAVIAFLIIRRQRCVRALRGRGWTFESRPAWSRSSTTTRPAATQNDLGRLGQRLPLIRALLEVECSEPDALASRS
jgi:hypothetical protein